MIGRLATVIARGLAKYTLAGTVCIAVSPAASTHETLYHIARQIAAPTARWDYATVDTKARRLYVGRVGGVLTVNLRDDTISILAPSELVHGVAPLADTDWVLSSNGSANTISVFSASTGQVIATIGAGMEPDAIIVEPHTGLVVATNEDSRDLTLVDPIKRVAVGTINLPGTPEYLAADGNGNVYDNLEDRNEIAQIDMASRKVVRRLALPGCQGPTGLAYDSLDDLLIAVCHNGVAKFLSIATGKITATVKIGKAPDAVLFDAKRRLALIPCGDPGILSVISVRSATDIQLRQELATQRGSRTGALDPSTGFIYLPAGRFYPPARAGAYPQIIPDSFSILVIEPTAENQ